MTTPTANFAWAKPVVGADSDTWGTELNTIFDAIDGQVFLYLLKTGGTVSGATSFTAAITSTVAGASSLNIRSGAAGSYGLMTLGRTAADVNIGVAANTNDIVTGSNAGDTVINVIAASAALRLYANGTGMLVDNAGQPYITGTVATTAVAANMVYDNGATLKILRSTSSLAYKDELRAITAAEARRIVRALNPFTYRSKARDDDPARRFIGLGAEHVAAVTDSLVQYSKDGKPDGVMYDRVGVLNLVMAQNHDRRLRLMECAVWVLTAALVASWIW